MPKLTAVKWQTSGSFVCYYNLTKPCLKLFLLFDYLSVSYYLPKNVVGETLKASRDTELLLKGSYCNPLKVHYNWLLCTIQ